MKTKFVCFAVFASLFVAAVLFAGCNPVSQDSGGYSGGSSASGGSSGGSDNPPSDLIGDVLPGTYTGHGYDLLFSNNGSGNISNSSSGNIRSASTDVLPTGIFKWSVSGYKVTMIMNNNRLEATYSSGSLKIRDKTFARKTGGSENTPSSTENCNGVHDWKTVFEAISGNDDHHVWCVCTWCGEKINGWHNFIGTVCVECRYDSTTGKGPDGGTSNGSRPKTTPENGKSLVYLIVSPSMFKETLQPFVDFKTQQGYDVEEMYVDKTYSNNDMIKNAIEIRKEIVLKYKGTNKQPTYILLVGDNTNMPTFRGTLWYWAKYQRANGESINRDDGAKGDYYVSDYFYSDFDGEYRYDASAVNNYTFTGDYVPEAYIGRFSARTDEQLKNQIDKTIYMSSKINEDNAKLLGKHIIAQDNSVDVAALTNRGVREAKAFLSGNSIFYTDNSNINNGTEVMRQIENGAATVIYYGHGDPESWHGLLRGYQIDTQLKNQKTYPIVFGMACFTGTFDLGYNDFSDRRTCIAEDFMRSKHGAVVYIGSTRESESDGNVYYLNSRDGYNGILPSLFHTGDTTQYARSIGEAHYIGSRAVQGEQSDFYKKQYLEFQVIFGDPSYMPYVTVATKAALPTADEILQNKGATINFTTAPNAVVALTKVDGAEKRSGVSVAVSDASGNINIQIPSGSGRYTLNTTAPKYIDNAVSFTID